MEFGNTKAADTVEDALREESQRMTFGEIGDLIDLYLKKADLRDTELFRNKDIEDAYSYVEMFTMKANGTFGIPEDEDGSMDVKLESFEDLISYVVVMKSDMLDIKEDYQLELNELKKELAELKEQHEKEISFLSGLISNKADKIHTHVDTSPFEDHPLPGRIYVGDTPMTPPKWEWDTISVTTGGVGSPLL